jgi:hypothetical protein
MVAMVSRNPEETAQAFDSLRRRMEEPIAIQPIEILPIPKAEEQ